MMGEVVVVINVQGPSVPLGVPRLAAERMTCCSCLQSAGPDQVMMRTPG